MKTRAATALAAALALGWMIGGCSPGTPPSEPSPSDPPTTSPTASPTPSPDPTPTDEVTESEEPDALPPGFPDPAGLIGQEAYDEQVTPGEWHLVVGGQPIDLIRASATCHDGGTGDICAFQIYGAAPAGAEPAEAALLVLLERLGELSDGTPTWLVLDAMVARTPDGAPAIIDACDGEQGVMIYAAPDTVPGEPVDVAAAWGPNATVSGLVELDPSSLTCAYMGD